jgi:hypothetical protein
MKIAVRGRYFCEFECELGCMQLILDFKLLAAPCR